MVVVVVVVVVVLLFTTNLLNFYLVCATNTNLEHPLMHSFDSFKFCLLLLFSPVQSAFFLCRENSSVFSLRFIYFLRHYITLFFYIILWCDIQVHFYSVLEPLALFFVSSEASFWA